jgi:hypothetical protein
VWIIDRVLELIGASGKEEPQPEALEEDSDTIGDACLDWRQGDVFESAKAFYFDRAWRPRQIPTTHGAVVVSQTCDACRPERETIQLAPVVRLEHSDEIKEAADGKRPRYVALPALGYDYFADLDGITTVVKTALLDCRRVCALEKDAHVREFAFSVSRRFGRFAYPDEVVRCLDPVSDALKSKARKPNSPLGQVLKSLHSIRVECEDWTCSPYELTLIIVLEPDAVPSDIDGIGLPPADLAEPDDKRLKEQINRYATYLKDANRSADESYYAWQYLADVWARQCEEAAATKGLTDHVRTVVAEVVAVDDFPLSRVLRTESLDLDYLSDSRKAIF